LNTEVTEVTEMPERKTRPDTRWLGRLLAANLRCYSHKRLKGKSLEHGGHGGHGDARAKPTRPDTRWLETSACSKLAPAKLPFVTSVTSVFKLCSAAPHLRTCKLLVFCSRILPFRAVGSHSLLTGSPGLGTARLVLGLAAQCNCTSSGPERRPWFSSPRRTCTQFGEARRTRSAQLAPSFRAPFRPGLRPWQRELHQPLLEGWVWRGSL